MADLGLTPDEIAIELCVSRILYSIFTYSCFLAHRTKSLFESSSLPLVRPFIFYNGRYVNPILYTPVLSVYDTCLSFPKELKCIWQRKLRTAGVLYLIIRYGTIHIALSRVLDSFYISSTIAVSYAPLHSNPALMYHL